MAQSTYRLGILPNVNLGLKYQQWKLNTKIESRQFVSQGSINVPLSARYQYNRTDFTVMGSRKVGLRSQLGAGYMLRMQSDFPTHRFIQQLALGHKMNAFRLASRFRTDQTFSGNDPVTFRLRYRISGEFPTNGQSVDPGELYLKFNHEYLGIFSPDNFDLEIRGLAGLGWEINAAHKAELGIDYRLSGTFEEQPTHMGLVYASWYWNPKPIR